MDNEATFGKLVKDHRLRLGLSQAEMAGRVGCATITLRKIESEALRPSVQMAERLASCLDTPQAERAEFVRLARRSPFRTPQTPRTLSPTPASVEIGAEDLRGRAVHGYELGDRIGAGGFGVVYRAFQPTVEREVAIKIILPEFANHPDFIRRFEAEARLIARLEHPHIVPLYDYWREPNAAYLVMRLLRGGSLGNLIKHGPLDPGLSMHMLHQIASALYAAHRSGIIHCDIKPANILLDEDQNAYLGDFGIAKILGDANPEDQTRTESRPGSAAYISPEQIRSEPLQPQVDIYSLGMLIFEMFTGRLPFPSSISYDTLLQKLHQPLPLLTEDNQRLSPSLDLVLQRATARDPSDRYPDVPSFLTGVQQAVNKTFILSDTQRLSDASEEIQLENPYKGLCAFDEADADDFFGREIAIRDLLGRMSEENDLACFTAVVGPSGSGKSSLVKAGLIPALRRGGLPGSENWFITQMTPGAQPMQELEAALRRVAIHLPENLPTLLAENERGLLRAARRILPEDGITELVLVIDQFEELFTLVEDESLRSQFLQSLVAAIIEPLGRLRIVITLRADFTDRPLQYVDFGEILSRRTEFVLPLTPDELEQAIIAPAKRAGLTLEAELVQRLLHEVSDQPGALPLLQYALTELFERRQGRLLTLNAYQQSGGVAGALASRAEQIYNGLREPEKTTARQLFLRLVTPSEGGDETRRRVLRNELETLTGLLAASDTRAAGLQLDALLEQFGHYRLLTFDRDPITRSPTVEVAHEALLREWPRLHAWLDESRSDLAMQRQLSRAANEWLQADREPSFLVRGSRLEQFEALRQNSGLAFTQAELIYLEASLSQRLAERASEEEQKQREMRLLHTRQRLRRALMVVLLVGLVIALGLSIFALNQRQGARRQAAVLLAAQAENELQNGYGDRAVLLALETLEKYPYVPQAERALGRAVSYNRALQQCVGHTSATTSVAWSPDGRRLATTSSIENRLRIWEAATCRELLVIDLPKGITGNVLDMGLTVKWSPDGRRLLTVTGDRYTVGSQDYNLILWDAETGKQLISTEIPNQTEAEMAGGISTVSHYVTGAAADFAPGGKRLATLGGDNTALIWDASLQGSPLVLTGHQNDVNSIAWSSDGQQLATASLDGTVRTWDGETGKVLRVMEGHTGRVNQAIWSPNGERLASAGEDARACIWEATSGKLVRCLEPEAGPVWSIAWSPDGSRLVTGHEDTGIRIWQVETGKLLETLRGHDSMITHLAWSPVDQRLASADNSGMVRVWNVAPSTAYLSLPYHFTFDLTWSSDGRYLVIPEGDFMNPSEPHALAVWDVVERKPAFEDFAPTFKTYPYSWLAADYSPDQRYFLVRGSGPIPDYYSDNSEIYVLDAVTGKLIRAYSVSDGSLIRDASWSPDGTRIAAAKTNGEILVWGFQTGEEVAKWLVDGLGNEGFCNEVEWSDDGTKLAAACGKGIARVWEVKSQKLVLDLIGHIPPSEVLSIMWSPDNSRLLTTSGNDEMGAQDTTARIWDVTTGKPLLVIPGHTRAVWRGDWSPDGSRIVTGSLDDTTRIWDAQTGAELLSLFTPTDQFAIVEWSPDGRYIAVGGRGMTSEVWRVWQSLPELMAFAKECCVFRSLSPSERQKDGLPFVESPSN